MLIEETIDTFERLRKQFRKERSELVEINSMLGYVGVSSIKLKSIDNLNNTLSDLDVIIAALKQHLNEGNMVIYNNDYFTHIIQKYKNKYQND